MDVRFWILGTGLVLSACTSPQSEKVNIVTSRDDPHVIAPQNCPDWSKSDGNGGSNYYNTLSSNFSCASVTNYGAMVEDPNDMITGKTDGRTNGARSAVSVTSYEAGPSSASSSTASSSSSSGASGAAPASQ